MLWIFFLVQLLLLLEFWSLCACCSCGSSQPRTNSVSVRRLCAQCNPYKPLLCQPAPHQAPNTDLDETTLNGEAISDLVTWGHQLTDPDSGFAVSLAEQVDEAAAMLWPGGAAPLPWGCASEEDFLLQLRAFRACACFPLTARIKANTRLLFRIPRPQPTPPRV